MTRTAAFSIALALIGATGAIAAGKPSALGQASIGMWELSGLPSARTPVRRCIAKLNELLVLEHRGNGCKQTVLNDDGTAMTVQFTCPSGFGTTSLRVVTPRSLRIETQGIASNSPYSYVVQARRTGDCQSEKKQERGH